MESAILTPKRTEYGKSIRKAYESGAIKESRHNMTELEPRKDGISNTLTTVQKDNLLLEVKQIGNMVDSGNWDNPQRGRIYSDKGLCPALNTVGGGNLEPKIIVAMRGRNPDNPSDRTAGSPTEQRLELNSQGICNTLTSVQKDNLVMENIVIKTREMRIADGNICGTLTTDSCTSASHNGSYGVVDNYRIRKLTPLECWRLMGFSDEDFHKAEEVNSNSQLYKQAGNSIVKNVLMAIFGQMMPGKENIYKE